MGQPLAPLVLFAVLVVDVQLCLLPTFNVVVHLPVLPVGTTTCHRVGDDDTRVGGTSTAVAFWLVFLLLALVFLFLLLYALLGRRCEASRDDLGEVAGIAAQPFSGEWVGVVAVPSGGVIAE